MSFASKVWENRKMMVVGTFGSSSFLLLNPEKDGCYYQKNVSHHILENSL